MSTFARAQFQEAAVQHIVARLRDRSPSASRRVLLADEVGLGKTVVARGVIEELLARRKRLKVVYLCSNTEIADQNRDKLDPKSRRPVGRITELALARSADDDGLRLYSFTPGTSLKEGTGLEWERRLLLYLLLRMYRPKSWNRWREFFRCGVKEDAWKPRTTRRALREAFRGKTSSSMRQALRAQWGDLNGDLISEISEAVRNFEPDDRELRKKRNALVARLRAIMQRVVLKELRPQLLILDEVQRFRDVLDEAANPDHIAYQLFAARTPVLILSATPYRALTLGHEIGDKQAPHYEDFLKTLDFLFDRDKNAPARIRAALEKLGSRLEQAELLLQLDTDLLDTKRQLEDDLRRVICRTERNWYMLDRRKGIDDVGVDSGALPRTEELTEYFRLHHALAAYGPGQVTEFWKSAPSLLTFLDSKYALLRRLRDERVRVPRALLTPACDVASLSSRNHRISRVVDVALGPNDEAPRLWTAPTYTYYKDQLFGSSRPRKLLVFSGWRFVPKTVAVVTSRVAVDRVGGIPDDVTQPLRFAERRSFHTFDVCFPSPFLAKVGGAAYRSAVHEMIAPTVNDILAATERELRSTLEAHQITVVPTGGDPTWRIVMRLENASGHQDMIAGALKAWGCDEKDKSASDAIGQHREWAQEWLAESAVGTRISIARLQRLALVAAFSPASCLWRALASVYSPDDAGSAIGDIASLCLGSMRRYFNRPYVQQVIRRHQSRMAWQNMTADAERGYTERVLVYSADAHLQAVVDEYVYLLRHAVQSDSVTKALERLKDVWSLATGTPRTNTAAGRGNQVSIKTDDEPHATHFALAFGDDTGRDEGPDGDGEKLRKSAVREAFNSPFWPFVLATTSVGQEGLDFHLYCRDVLHWNLPSNPVDLEQREGRVNRRDCLAVRESIARDWRLRNPALWSNSSDRGRNPWPLVFDAILAHDDEQKYKHGLFPHWIYECRNPADSVRIQRHVPCFSTSRDAAKYERLKRGLALYRLVFGQPNQEDLLEKLQRQIEGMSANAQEQVFRRLSSYMLNLSPIGHEQALRHAEQEADDLLAGRPPGGLTKLLMDVEHMREERQAELSTVNDVLCGLLDFVRRATLAGKGIPQDTARQAVAALAYLRNPYDRVFDLHVEGGFVDDVAVLREAWAAIVTESASGTSTSRTNLLLAPEPPDVGTVAEPRELEAV